MAEIVVVHAGQVVKRIRLDKDAMTVGRDQTNDIVINDPRVSRSHARILKTGDGFTFEDAGSTHGSLIGGQRVTKRLLKEGDIIQVGNRHLNYLEKEGAEVKPAAAGTAAVGGGDTPDTDEFDTWSEFQTMLMTPGTGQESARRLRALFEISRVLDTATDFDGVLDLLMDKALAIMGAERGFIMLQDISSKELRVHSARDRSGAIEGVDAESVSKSLMKKVLDKGEPVLVGNAITDVEWGTESMLANKIHSAMCVPLKNGTNVTGVIYVDHRSRVKAFNDADLSFFTTFAIQAKAAIDSSRAYWQLVDSLFDASADFVIVCGSDGVIRRANEGAAKLVGKDSASLVGQRLAALVEEEDQLISEQICRDSVEQGVVSGVDIRLTAGEGKVIPISVSSFAMNDRQGGVTGFCLIGRDLTKEKTLIEQLTAANFKLRELNEMKSQFVGMIAHEFKSPLSVVVGYADMMLGSEGDGPPPAKTRDYLGKILQAGERLVALIQELLDLTRIETGRTSLRRAAVDVRAMLMEIADNVSLRAEEKKVKIDMKIPDDLPELECDKDLIWRAFDNFFTNGIKYNRENGKLEVVAKLHGEDLEFIFKDSGIGISEADQKKLFQRFFRSDSVQGEYPGTGLGLSIVKAIVERHDGRISVESVLGTGTTFIVRIPQRMSESTEA